MTLARSLVVALGAVAVLVGAQPGVEAQFPRGLLAAAPRDKPEGNAICTIETRPLSFGNYDPEAGANLDAVAQVIYTCNNHASKIRIEMTPGLASTFERRMSAGNGLDYLNYNIYLDATHQTIWGQGLFGTDVYYESNPPNNTPVTVLGYGRIPGGQNPATGQYADVLSVRVLF